MAVTPVASYPNILKYGTKAAYLAIQSKSADVLYFCTDSKEIFKGTINMTDNVVYLASADTKPAAADAIPGKLYFNGVAGANTWEVSDGNAWKVVSYPIVTTIDADPDNDDDVHVPSAKAVATLVANAIAGEGVIASIDASTTTEGAIDVTDGAGNVEEVIIPGVVTTPSYDATTRTFTFPISDDAQNPVVVELGTDIFIDPTANNRYENGNIYLYLNDGTASSDPTELVIPVTSLVTDYFGDDTSSIQVDIDNSTHKVTAAARIRSTTAQNNLINALKVSSASGDEGLYVAVRPDDATVGQEFTNALKYNATAGAEGLYVDTSAIEADINALDGNVQALAAATTVWGTF